MLLWIEWIEFDETAAIHRTLNSTVRFGLLKSFA